MDVIFQGEGQAGERRGVVRTVKRTQASSDAVAINIHGRVKTRIILLLVPLLHNKGGKTRPVCPVLVHFPPK